MAATASGSLGNFSAGSNPECEMAGAVALPPAWPFILLCLLWIQCQCTARIGLGIKRELKPRWRYRVVCLFLRDHPSLLCALAWCGRFCPWGQLGDNVGWVLFPMDSKCHRVFNSVVESCVLLLTLSARSKTAQSCKPGSHFEVQSPAAAAGGSQSLCLPTNPSPISTFPF